MIGARPSSVLLENAAPEGGDCRLTDLLAVLCHANDGYTPNRQASPHDVVDAASDLPIPPSAVEIDKMRAWPQGLQAAAYADDSYRRLIWSPSSAMGRAAFLPTAPVLRALYAGLSEPDYTTAPCRWLDRLDWPLILRLAKERDTAALAICAGRAWYDHTTRNIVALDA